MSNFKLNGTDPSVSSTRIFLSSWHQPTRSLRSCLSGKAARLIQALEMTPQNYGEVLNILKLRYDNKRFIFQSHIEKIFTIKDFAKQSVSELRDFIDSVNGNIGALQSIASKDQIANGILLYLIVSKLD